MKRVEIIAIALLLFASPHCLQIGTDLEKGEPPTPFVYSFRLKGAITPSSMESLQKAIDRSHRDGAVALIVLLDTPGGLASSMDEMIRSILSSPVPVLTFVHPPGSTCGSAGVYIMYASHVAAMAPATNIGSATPVMIGAPSGEGPRPSDRIPEKAGADDTINLKRKQLNHAIAQIRSLADYRGRNADFAERTVTLAENITSTRALTLKAIDLIAENETDLLDRSHGRRVRMLAGMQTLNLKGVRILEIQEDFRSQFLGILSNPNVAYILMMIGMIGILAEIQYPGAIFPGTIGAISLLLALYAMQTLPINYTGLGLILLGVIFFILEISVVSYGMLTIAGIASFIIGSMMLVESDEEMFRISIEVILTTSILTGGFLAFMIYKTAQTMKRRPASGMSGLLEETGEALSDITDLSGSIRIHSEIWSARSEVGIIKKGSRVNVVSIEGLTLHVKPAPVATPADSNQSI
jgi:membrane-bound serine protease (ClpP class)